jgi:hypothetical protein
MKAVSLDIETLGTNSDAVVLSIGACLVTPSGVHTDQVFYSRVNIQQQIDAGRSITEGTLRFWFEQDRKVQQSTFGEGDGPSIREVVSKLYSWLEIHEFPGVYCKGPQFDAAILDSMADSAKVARPVHYRKWRDIRTLEELITWAGHEDKLLDLNERLSKWGSAHDALADAQMQGEVICFAMNLSAGGVE